MQQSWPCDRRKPVMRLGGDYIWTFFGAMFSLSVWFYYEPSCYYKMYVQQQFDYTELCIMFKACDRRNPGRSGATAIIIQPHHWSILKFTDASFYSHDSIIAPSDSSSQLYFQIFHAIWYSPKLSLQFCSVHRVTHSIGYYWYKARLKIIGICKENLRDGDTVSWNMFERGFQDCLQCQVCDRRKHGTAGYYVLSQPIWCR